MRIAVCDDNIEFLQGISNLLNMYGEENHRLVEYKTFTNPLELVMQMERGVHYDVILLDICMPGMNGIQCAKDIRQYDNLVKIVFLTSSTEYAVESYSVKAHNYLLKPIQKEDLFSVLQQLEKEEDVTGKKFVVLKTKAGITKIFLNKLEYCEVINRKLVLHLVNNEEYESTLRMNELEENLESFGMFLRVHRSFLVNMDYIQSLTTHSIVMESGVKIPVPREKYVQIKQTYMEYVFHEKDVIVLGD